MRGEGAWGGSVRGGQSGCCVEIGDVVEDGRTSREIVLVLRERFLMRCPQIPPRPVLPSVIK